MSDQTQYLTEEGYKKAKDELEHLKTVKRPEIAERIKDAKELGDLSENAEYADAREEQSFTEGRIIELANIIKNAQVIQSDKSDPSVVQIGDEVTIEKDGQTSAYTIVGSNEANPAEGRVSNVSPIGKALLGKKENEDAVIQTPKGESKCKIVKITASA